jgi:hypothetical protein
MQPINSQKDSSVWIFQTWTAFILSVSMTTVAIIKLPVNNWMKGSIGMGLAFSVGSTFALAKNTRDLHEARKIVSRIDDAQVEKLLSQHYLLK